MIEKDDIKNLAALSRIEVEDNEVEDLRRDFESIIEYIGEIQNVGGELEKKAGSLRNVMREDADPHPSGQHTEAIVAAFPKSEKNYLKVKKILSQD